MNQSHKIASKVTFRWHDYCRVLKARGVINDFSHGECRRARKMILEDIEAGRVVQIKFGHPIAEYELT
jgi:hypothetical protein